MSSSSSLSLVASISEKERPKLTNVSLHLALLRCSSSFPSSSLLSFSIPASQCRRSSRISFSACRFRFSRSRRVSPGSQSFHSSSINVLRRSSSSSTSQADLLALVPSSSGLPLPHQLRTSQAGRYPTCHPVLPSCSSLLSTLLRELSSTSRLTRPFLPLSLPPSSRTQRIAIPSSGHSLFEP